MGGATLIYYNIRPDPQPVTITSAMSAEISEHVWSYEEIARYAIGVCEYGWHGCE
jgi:hypothetical protein